MVNIWPLRAVTAAMPASAGDALLSNPPWLDLRRCRPPAAKLPPEELDLLDRLLRDRCDTRRHLRISTQFLEAAALGYQGIARMPARRAVLLAALHYLEAVEPTRLAKPGGPDAIRRLLAGLGAR